MSAQTKEQLSMESSSKSSSALVDSSNGVMGHEKSEVDSPSNGFDSNDGLYVPIVRDIDNHSEVEHVSESPSNGQIRAKLDSVKISDPVSPSNLHAQFDLNKCLIDTTAPFESVKEAVSKFGGIVDWKAHKVQTVQRRKLIEQELEKVQKEMPRYKEQSEIAEKSKIQVLKELESTKRLIEELKLNLERAQTEEIQAKQDSELAQLRVEEMEKGIAHDASVAAKTQLEVAKARHDAAISDLKSVKDELESLKKEYVSLVSEKDIAMLKAEEAVAASKEIEKKVEGLTIELISTKESLETAHAAHLEAEEHRIGAAMAKEQDLLTWDKELKQAEEDLENLNTQIESAKELKLKLNEASSVLTELKAELTSYLGSKVGQEIKGSNDTATEGTETHAGMQAAVAAANKELEEVKHSIEKATDEVNILKVAATSLKAELEKEETELSNLRQREGMASIAVASLETELERIKSEIAVVQLKEKDAKEKMGEFPKQLQHVSQEADDAKLGAELANEELKRANEEAEQAKAGAKTMESRLLAAEKEIEAAKASERLALAAIKALQESESTKPDDDESSPAGVTLSLEEYYELSKRAHEAEEQANLKVAAAISQIEVAKEAESTTLKQLEDANQEVEQRKEALGSAIEKAEKAKEGKLGVEQELRTWRSDHGQRRKAGETIQGSYGSPRKSIGDGQRNKQAPGKTPDPALFEQGIKIERVVDSSSPPVQYEQDLGLKGLEQIANTTSPVQYTSSPKTHVLENVSSSKATFGQSNTVKKKRRRFMFPKLFMFLNRRKTSSKSS